MKFTFNQGEYQLLERQWPVYCAHEAAVNPHECHCSYIIV